MGAGLGGSQGVRQGSSQRGKSPEVGIRCRDCWTPCKALLCLSFAPEIQSNCLARKVDHLSRKQHFYLIFNLCRKLRQKNREKTPPIGLTTHKYCPALHPCMPPGALPSRRLFHIGRRVGKLRSCKE